jgi:phosphatidate cytidylyltransferase
LEEKALKQRVITGIVAGAVFLLFLFLGKWYFTCLIMLAAAVGYMEFSRMNREPPFKLTGLLGLVLCLFLTFPLRELTDHDQLNAETAVWIGMFLLFALTVVTKNKVTIDRVALAVLGAVYIGFGFHYMIATLAGSNGLFWSLLLYCCIWGTDSGAFFAGRAFGKRRLWPAISPNKTVEGALGGILVSIVVAVVFSFIMPNLLVWHKAIWLGLLIAMLGQAGDLIQSAYKRVRGLKDTGAIFPGHGGVLDRCDSWLIVFPFVQLLGLIPQ